MTETVRAAGGVIVQRDEDEGIRVLVVHRPKYDDWTFPKGKAEAGESDEECALREVLEETGLQCELRSELPSTAYVDSQGRSKTVRYWVMVALSGSFTPTAEVDELRWLSVDEAAAQLSYTRDVTLLRQAF